MRRRNSNRRHRRSRKRRRFRRTKPRIDEELSGLKMSNLENDLPIEVESYIRQILEAPHHGLFNESGRPKTGLSRSQVARLRDAVEDAVAETLRDYQTGNISHTNPNRPENRR